MPTAGGKGSSATRSVVTGGEQSCLVCWERCRQVGRGESTHAASAGIGTSQAKPVNDVSVAMKGSQMHRCIARVVLDIRVRTPSQKPRNEARQPQRSRKVKKALAKTGAKQPV